MQIAEVEKAETEIHAPRRAVFGRDGKTRTVPAPRRDPPPGHVVPVDRYGVEIPVEVQAAFDGEDALKEVLSLLGRARARLRRAAEAGEAAFAAVRQDALVNADNAWRFVGAARPHCVCRMCQGTGCRACHSRGWQTEEEYGRNPKEFRA